MAKVKRQVRFPFKVKERYDTGIAKTYEMAGLEFDWTDWVLCEVSFQDGNPVHWCLASSFREVGGKHMTCTLLNPSYEEMYDFREVEKLAHFKPVKVIQEVRQSLDHLWTALVLPNGKERKVNSGGK